MSKQQQGTAERFKRVFEALRKGSDLAFTSGGQNEVYEALEMALDDLAALRSEMERLDRAEQAAKTWAQLRLRSRV